MSKMLDVKQAAERLNVPARLLNNWRVQGRGPRYTKVGPRLVRYSESDLEQWLKSQVVVPAEEAGAS
jgi:excisionase family DNA binding protein